MTMLGKFKLTRKEAYIIIAILAFISGLTFYILPSDYVIPIYSSMLGYWIHVDGITFNLIIFLILLIILALLVIDLIISEKTNK